MAHGPDPACKEVGSDPEKRAVRSHAEVPIPAAL